jgi:hypothetical protein
VSSVLCESVWRSGLPKGLKMLALALAHFGDQNGDRIFPSVATLSKRTRMSERNVKRSLKALKNMTVIVPVGPLKRGRGKTLEYKFFPENLPIEAPEMVTKSTLNGDKTSTIKGDKDDHKRVTDGTSFEEERVTKATVKGDKTDMERVTNGARFFDERVTNGARFSTFTSSEVSLESTPCEEIRPPEGLVLREGLVEGEAITRARGEPIQENRDGTNQPDLEMDMNTVDWMKKTWSAACQENHRHVRFPRSLAGQLAEAEVKFDHEDYRRSWLEFLDMGTFDVRKFLGGIGGFRSAPAKARFRSPERSFAAAPAGDYRATSVSAYTRRPPRLEGDALMEAVRKRYEESHGPGSFDRYDEVHSRREMAIGNHR